MLKYSVPLANDIGGQLPPKMTLAKVTVTGALTATVVGVAEDEDNDDNNGTVTISNFGVGHRTELTSTCLSKA